MTSFVSLVFCLSAATVLYVYFGYPALLCLGAFRKRQPSIRGSARPRVSLIVAAHNEETTIEAKLRNLSALDYPQEFIEILVGNDGSTDRTEEIVRRFGTRVIVISSSIQQGKSATQNKLASAASGEILVFTDADTTSGPDALSRLAGHFADPHVGLVTGRALYCNEDETSVAHNEGRYLRYDTWLRRLESACSILAVASGSFFAVRKSLWNPVAADLGDDFVLPLEIARAGFRNVLDTRVVAVTRLTQNRHSSMLRMKVRIISKDFRALLAHLDLLNPFQYGALSIGLWSHKLLRWFVPYFLLALCASNACVLDKVPFRLAFAMQTAFYALALVGLTLQRAKWPVFSVPASFCLVNFAALLGTLKCLLGNASGRWTPERSAAVPVPPTATAARGTK